MVVLPTTVAEADVPPNVTVAPDVNPLPETTTAAPPLLGPDDGDTLAICGAVFVGAPKNSAMLGAPAAAPGKLVKPTPSAISRSVLWCCNSVDDWKPCGVRLLITTV